MLKKDMYVRCPVDIEDPINPRNFICGKIKSIDEFSEKVVVEVYDPFKKLSYFPLIPKGNLTYSIDEIERATLFINSVVVFQKVNYRVLSYYENCDGFIDYYLESNLDKSIKKVSEKEIVAAFNNGKISPVVQLKNYEFQNPCWYFGRSMVSKNVNILDQSIYGFKQLAGARIFLLPHQLNTILRCLKEMPCRYMLADEVGMGKTIEAAAVLKVYLEDRCDQNVLIITPQNLDTQWETELFFKFNIVNGENEGSNNVKIVSIDELDFNSLNNNYDFIIVDEIHRLLKNKKEYEVIHYLSGITENILLLSATPVQKRRDEYLELLRLLFPAKYDNISSSEFSVLVEKQENIVYRCTNILGAIDELKCEIYESEEIESESCMEIAEEINDDLEEFCDMFSDPKLYSLLETIDINSDDYGLYRMKVMMSYICSNYQIERNVIRNRRKTLESCDADGDNNVKLLPAREVIEIEYSFRDSKNIAETETYIELCEWIETHGEKHPEAVKKLLEAFFSSSWAFLDVIRECFADGITFNENLLSSAKSWKVYEEYLLDNIETILEDPYTYEEYYSSRIVILADKLSQDLYKGTMVLFTGFEATFELYKKLLLYIFKTDELSFFGRVMGQEERELNVYKFQNESDCHIILCDNSGGEGRNFQIADYVVHIDLPWDANMIEQRIGRLDRLDRDPERQTVYSVVIHSVDTFEHSLFRFWNEGLNLFNQSLSGMEIIMDDINEQIEDAIRKDFKYGLEDKISDIIASTKDMRETIKMEQFFDTAAIIYRPVYNEIKRNMEFYDANENYIFAESMRSWAKLVGLISRRVNEEVIMFSPNDFSPKSAMNALYVPVNIDEYLENRLNAFTFEIQEKYEKEKKRRESDLSIRGTFSRETAIRKDYINFFAPGNMLYDSIVNNAVNSCKGQCSAFSINAEINWSGFIFIWSVKPRITELLENGISFNEFKFYRNYFIMDQIVTPYSIVNDDGISDECVISEFKRILNGQGYSNLKINYGSRNKLDYILANKHDGEVYSSNIECFRNYYDEYKWENIITDAYEKTLTEAKQLACININIDSLTEEMERNLSYMEAATVFTEENNINLDEVRDHNKKIIELMRMPEVVLESAVFVRMVEE